MAHEAHDHVSAEGHPLPSFSHPMPVPVLLATFGALVMFTIVTVVVAKMLPLGRFEIWVSLGIASVKAVLVMLFFMHMLHDKGFNAIVFLSSFLFAALFLGFALADTDQYQENIRAADPNLPGVQTTPLLERWNDSAATTAE
ncbi:MAG TPA: caa(3)-type oxidase subunit IV [Planctomycetaceae bacterium]|nr:caa(3)-type oxidase subunit IV [Planctomycetaceae bacterium]HRE99259.1 cytochrome C oxidase subunit IV family protein [Pirellulaceae bacterium]